MTTTWNPSDIGSNLTLSMSNLRLTSNSPSGGWSACRSTTSQSGTGQYYFEIGLVSGGGSNFFIGGIADGSATLSFPGQTSDGEGYQGLTGSFYYAGGSGSGMSPDPALIGDTMCFILDLTNSYFGCRRNGGSWYNNSGGTFTPGSGGCPLHPTSVPLFIMCGLYTYTNVVDLRTQSSQFLYSIPSGFSAWDASTPPPASSSSVNVSIMT